MVCLLAVAHAGVELVQHACLGRAVLGRDDGRGRGDVLERLRDAGAPRDVGLDRRPDAAVRLAARHAAAVGADVDVLAVEREVVLGVARAEREGPGSVLRARLDHAAAGILATVEARSTSAPCSSRTSRARCEWNLTPTCSSTSRVASWIWRTSSGGEQLEPEAPADVQRVCVGHGVLLSEDAGLGPRGGSRRGRGRGRRGTRAAATRGSRGPSPPPGSPGWARRRPASARRCRLSPRRARQSSRTWARVCRRRGSRRRNPCA